MHTVITYLDSHRMVTVQHFDTRYAASSCFDSLEVRAGHYIELRDRFGCLARRSN